MVTVEPGDLCAWPKCTAQEMVSEEMMWCGEMPKLYTFFSKYFYEQRK